MITVFHFNVLIYFSGTAWDKWASTFGMFKNILNLYLLDCSPETFMHFPSNFSLSQITFLRGWTIYVIVGKQRSAHICFWLYGLGFVIASSFFFFKAAVLILLRSFEPVPLFLSYHPILHITFLFSTVYDAVSGGTNSMDQALS